MSTANTALQKPVFDYDAAFQAKMARTFVQLPDFALVMADTFDPDVLDKKVHKWVVRTTLAHAKKYGAGLDKSALLNYFKEDVRKKKFKKEEIADARAFVSSIDKPVKQRDYVKDEVLNFVRNQDIRNRVLELLECMESRNFDEAQRIFAEGQRVQNLGFGSLGHFYVRDRDQRLERRRAFKMRGIPTGLPHVDRYLKHGGVPRKTLNGIIAPAGRGKTGCLVNVGTNAIIFGGAKVLHLSINEMSEEAMQDRYDARIAQVDLNLLEDKSKRKRLWRKAGEFGKKYGESLVIKEVDAISVGGIEAYVKMLATVGFYPDVIIVDYADLITPARHYESSYEEIGGIYKDLRALAKRLDVVIWTASQTKREALTKPVITMADLADSFRKAHVADLLIALCQTTKERRNRRARFYVGKNRFGASEFELPPMRVNWARQTLLPA